MSCPQPEKRKMLLPTHIGSSWRYCREAGVEEGVCSRGQGVGQYWGVRLPSQEPRPRLPHPGPGWPLTSVPHPRLAKPDTKFLFCSRENLSRKVVCSGFPRAQAALLQNPLVKSLMAPLLSTRSGGSQSWLGTMGMRQGWRDPARDTPPSSVVSKLSLCMKLCSPSPSGSQLHVYPKAANVAKRAPPSSSPRGCLPTWRLWRVRLG